MGKHLFNLKGEDLAKALAKKVQDFQDYIIRIGRARKWAKQKDYYENKFFSSTEGIDIFDAGEQGELQATAFNEFRNIVRHMINPIVSQTPSFTVTAANSDIESRIGSDIGKKIINYYDKVKRYGKVGRRVAEIGVVIPENVCIMICDG